MTYIEEDPDNDTWLVNVPGRAPRRFPYAGPQERREKYQRAMAWAIRCQPIPTRWVNHKTAPALGAR